MATIRNGTLGAGSSTNNRTALPANNGSWPSPIALRLNGSNLVAFGQSNSISMHYQFAATNAANAVLELYLDDDANPFNGNERLVRQLTLLATGSNQVASVDPFMEWNAQTASPGEHRVFARVRNGGKARLIYAPEKVTILSSFQAPMLAVNRSGILNFRVDVIGVPGQRIVLQRSTDLFQWQNLATNWLNSNRVSFSETPGTPQRFYRAYVQ